MIKNQKGEEITTGEHEESEKGQRPSSKRLNQTEMVLTSQI